ncbi:MAG: fasciclin domain-containing protein [Rhodospirillaceae bacterium]|nr:MAG: fasciclin domain-containing protein [Rhodospirillaceae bacterium]
MFFSAGAHASNVLQTMDQAGAFSMFLKAVKISGLQETLSGDGPFTVLAPTDDAFSKLPKGMVKKLFDTENPETKVKLKALVNNHVLAGIVLARDVTGRRLEAVTVQGGTLAVDGTRAFMVENAKVTKPDLMADNGVVHVIDMVLLPR